MGNQLFRELTVLTGLPKERISEELATILQRIGSSPSAVTLEDLRAAMASYLSEVMLEMMTKDGESEKE